MTSRTVVDSDKTAGLGYALETALGRLHDIITDKQAEHLDQIQAAAVLGDLILRYKENLMLGEHFPIDAIPVIR